MNKLKLLLVAFLALLPVLANASELHDEFINRCLFPLGEGEPFVTEGLLGPFSALDEDIGVQGAAAVRKSWQFPNNNWVFGTIEAGSANFVIARACGITVDKFQGSQSSVIAKTMSSLGLPTDFCTLELAVTGQFAYQSVIQSDKSGIPVLVNFSPVNDGSHVLMAWQVSHEIAASPCAG